MKNRQSIAALFSIISILGAGQASADFSTEVYPDLYGSVLFDRAPAKGADVAAHPGYGDNYGSILLDPTPARTADVAAHPGYGDNYGSILLDLKFKRTSQIVVHHDSPDNNTNI
jgi:hypothetical protein